MIEIFKNIIDIFLANPTAQTIGIVAFLVSVYNFGFCKDKKFIFFTMVASAIWGIHFLLLGLLSAAYINLIDVSKNALALKYEKNKYMTVTFIVIYTVISYFTFDGLISLIPLSTAIASTILVFYVRGIYLNIGFLFVIGLWMTYNYLGHSIGGFTTDTTIMISGIFGILKTIYKSKKAKKKLVEKEKEVLESVN